MSLKTVFFSNAFETLHFVITSLAFLGGQLPEIDRNCLKLDAPYFSTVILTLKLANFDFLTDRSIKIVIIALEKLKWPLNLIEQ